MNEKITSLIKIQEFDTQLDVIAQSKAKLSPQREKLKADIQALSQRMEDGKKSLTEAQVKKKSLELDVEAKEQAMRKNSGELNSVKSNEAYKALLSQIEDAKKAKAAIEDQVLEVMESIEALQRELKDAEKALQQEKAGLEKQVADVDAEEARIQGEWDQKKKERDAYFESLAPDVKQPYEAILRSGSRKKGAAVVPIKGNICGGCQTILPPSVVNETMKGKDLVTCETCSRILYIPSAAVAS